MMYMITIVMDLYGMLYIYDDMDILVYRDYGKRFRLRLDKGVYKAYYNGNMIIFIVRDDDVYYFGSDSNRYIIVTDFNYRDLNIERGKIMLWQK